MLVCGIFDCTQVKLAFTSRMRSQTALLPTATVSVVTICPILQRTCEHLAMSQHVLFGISHCLWAPTDAPLFNQQLSFVLCVHVSFTHYWRASKKSGDESILQILRRFKSVESRRLASSNRWRSEFNLPLELGDFATVEEPMCYYSGSNSRRAKAFL